MANENVDINGENTSPLLSVKRFSKKHPDFPEGSLRHLLFYKPDGFERCIRKIGRKVLIHEAEFFGWIEAINVKPPYTNKVRSQGDRP